MFALTCGVCAAELLIWRASVYWLGATREAPVVRDGVVVVRRVVTLGVAFDHRVMDGYQAGAMARRFSEAFAAPDAMLR